ncbi:MAG TPA: NADP-dependent oxidoreductase [Candidatus Sulfotelmatobacter sp.]|nr:NADP-dependent oxidoreductase [Candidatus Sulfotelmatobacter sp.]
MKAIVISKYGGPEVLEYKDAPDPSPGPDEVLVQLAATSVNPFDFKRRSGAVKAFAPVSFPGILGIDVSGTVIALGPGVKGFSKGDCVFGMADHAYAERVVAKAANLAKIPPGLDPVDAAALPLVTTTGRQLITDGVPVSQKRTILVTGALGGVGRSAIFTAKSLGATVIAGVRKTQVEQAAELGADSIVAIDDPSAISGLQPLDAVADTVNGVTAESLIARVKPGGVFASVVGPPKNSAKFPDVKVIPVVGHSDAQALLQLAKAVVEGSLEIPIATKMPLKQAADAQALAEKGAGGKVLLLP